MKTITETESYKRRIEQIVDEIADWAKIGGSSILLTGATGMIGRVLVDVIMARNERSNKKCHLICTGRNVDKAKVRLGEYFNREDFEFREMNINQKIVFDGKVDYIIHAASSTHPLQYASDPVGAIMPNIIGLNNLLELAVAKKTKKIIFLSSVEIYGENCGNTEKFNEDYLGYIDCNTLRAGYPESKRVGEALCQAYKEQYKLDFVTLRLARVFGPTMLKDDSKACSQFIKNALAGEDIVLKSKGTQKYSYLYAADAVRAILFAIEAGESGEAYNVADEKFDISLRELARLCAESVGRKVVFDVPSEQEAKGFSKATKAMLDASKINEAGFSIVNNIEECIKETIDIMSEIEA